MNNCLNIFIDEPQWLQALPDAEELSQRVFDLVIAYVRKQEEIDFIQNGQPLSVNLSLASDTAVQELNCEFRGLDRPTNVLSFARLDDPDFAAEIEEADIAELGDIIIALETMQKEAASENISLRDHYCHLLTHGLLHLLGFDHQDDDEAEYMESFEISILQQLDIANPYKE